MSSLFKACVVGFLSVTFFVALSTVALSVNRDVYDELAAPQPGKTIRGKIVNVDERDRAQQRWDVSVQNGETGEVVALHIDKTTHRRDIHLPPMIGNNVVVKYNEQSKHAITFLTDARLSR